MYWWCYPVEHIFPESKVWIILFSICQRITIFDSVSDDWEPMLLKNYEFGERSPLWFCCIYSTDYKQTSANDVQVFYIENPQAMGLQLYYESPDLSLLILLPEDIGGLNQVKGSVYS